MKGKIDSSGYLWIERGEKMKPQQCLSMVKHSSHGSVGMGTRSSVSNRSCGDWCPLFGEPILFQRGVCDNNLMLCQGRILHFDKFTDERKNETAIEGG